MNTRRRQRERERDGLQLERLKRRSVIYFKAFRSWQKVYLRNLSKVHAHRAIAGFLVLPVLARYIKQVVCRNQFFSFTPGNAQLALTSCIQRNLAILRWPAMLSNELSLVLTEENTCVAHLFLK